MPNIGPPELIIILIIALIVLGPGKLPEVGASLGKSIREFRKAASDVRDATSVETAHPAPTAPAAAPMAPSAPAAAAPMASAVPAGETATETALRHLHEQGVLSDEEYEAKKAAAKG